MLAAVAGQSWATAAHPFNLEINGIDVIASVPMESIRIEMAGPGSNGSCTFTIADPTAAISVEAWDEVRFIEHAATRPILFGGFVQSVRYVVWAANGRDIEVQCVGYGILMDRKVVPSFDMSAGDYEIGPRIVSVVNRHGGRVSSLEQVAVTGPDATYSVSVHGSGVWIVASDNSNFSPIADNQTLRSALDAILAMSQFTEFADGTVDPVGTAYWVDGAARLCAVPDVPYEAGMSAPGYDAQFDGGTPGLSIDTSGTYRVTRLEYEVEDTDRLSSEYVVGDSGGLATPDTAVANRFVTSTNMKVGAYTLANTTATHGAGFKVTVTVTPVTGGDTVGSLVVVGTGLDGDPATETIALTATGTTGTQTFTSLASITGEGWAIVSGNDTIVVGQSEDAYYPGVWVRATPPPRAGDLEAVISDGRLTTTILATGAGGTAISQVATASVRSSLDIAASAPVDCWPGRCLSLTWDALGLAATGPDTAKFRITGVRIAFLGGTHREYTIDFGGSQPAPSMARRTGRYATL